MAVLLVPTDEAFPTGNATRRSDLTLASRVLTEQDPIASALRDCTKLSG